VSYPSTFSIVACDPIEKSCGIAVASKFLAVGAVVPWARASAGAVATQSHANTSFGPLGLDLMEAGITAPEALEQLIKNDPEAEKRQVGMVDARGGSASFTGKSCANWAGSVNGPNFAIQGNILAGEQVIEAMKTAFLSSTSQGLVRRLYTALLAGDQAGGDRRGRQSAAILLVKPRGGYGGYNDRWVDYRVDDHGDPVRRLGELLNLHDLYFGHSQEADQVNLTGEFLVRMQNLMRQLGYYTGTSHGHYDKATRLALESFIGNENFEERTDYSIGRIDRPVLNHLFDRFEAKEPNNE
jgi:uncharacterized Ntn-hydrolase superfamily protein